MLQSYSLLYSELKNKWKAKSKHIFQFQSNVKLTTLTIITIMVEFSAFHTALANDGCFNWSSFNQYFSIRWYNSETSLFNDNYSISKLDGILGGPEAKFVHSSPRNSVHVDQFIINSFRELSVEYLVLWGSILLKDSVISNRVDNAKRSLLVALEYLY